MAALPFGGPGAAIAAAALAKGITGKGHLEKDLLKGAFIGGATAALAPMGANALGANAATMGPPTRMQQLLLKYSGANSPSFLNQIGISSAPHIGGGIGLFSNAAGIAPGLLDNSFLSKLPLSTVAALSSGRRQLHPQAMDIGSDGSLMPEMGYSSRDDSVHDGEKATKKLKAAMKLAQRAGGEWNVVHPHFPSTRAEKSARARKGGLMKFGNGGTASSEPPETYDQLLARRIQEFSPQVSNAIDQFYTMHVIPRYRPARLRGDGPEIHAIFSFMRDRGATTANRSQLRQAEIRQMLELAHQQGGLDRMRQFTLPEGYFTHNQVMRDSMMPREAMMEHLNGQVPPTPLVQGDFVMPALQGPQGDFRGNPVSPVQRPHHNWSIIQQEFPSVRGRKRITEREKDAHQLQQEIKPFTEEEEQEEHARGGHIKKYARGGAVIVDNPGTQYIRGRSDGQADDVRAKIPPGSFIFNATNVSAMGNGYSDNGAHRLLSQEADLLKLAPNYVSPKRNEPPLDVWLSPGEVSWKPEAVDIISALAKKKGKVILTNNFSNERGARRLEKLRKNLHTQKGIKSTLPPKTKPFLTYMEY